MAGESTRDRDDATDAELLAAHVAGDAEAFGILFARHRDRLWAVALRTCRDAETAADGLQDGVIAAFRRAATFRGEAAVTTWLHRVVVNACLDRLRAGTVRRTESLPDEPALRDRLEGEARIRRGSPVQPADPADPADVALRRDQRDRILAALATLPVDQRAAVVLVDMEGHSVAEVAAILECPEGTVKSRCSRARARLAPLLADLVDSAAPVRPTSPPPPGNPAAPPHVGPLAPRGPPAPSAADQ